VLPYLKVNQGNKEEVEQIEEVQTPDILGKNIVEAGKILKESGLELTIENQTEELDKENTIITEQVPSAGIIVRKGSKVSIK
jgi:beta-lactam-binding protein with PASTA domain